MESCGNTASAESLEARLLLSVFVHNHVLHVEGTAGDDRIVFRHHDSEHLNVEVNGRMQQFEKDQVKRIDISAGAGKDFVYMGRNNVFKTITGPDPNCHVNCPQFATRVNIVAVPGSIEGGVGDDTIVGGSGDWILRGGDGADQIQGGDQTYFALVNINRAIFGGRGDDTLIGGRTRDRIVGGEGDDVLIGGGGDDLLEGGEGFDTLEGGGGNDTLNPGPQPRPLLPLLF